MELVKCLVSTTNRAKDCKITNAGCHASCICNTGYSVLRVIARDQPRTLCCAVCGASTVNYARQDRQEDHDHRRTSSWYCSQKESQALALKVSAKKKLLMKPHQMMFMTLHGLNVWRGYSPGIVQSILGLLDSNLSIMDWPNPVTANHDYVAMFWWGSSRYTRFGRWIQLCHSVLIELFVVTVSFQIFYGNDGTCQTCTSKIDCLTPSTNSTKCDWSSTFISSNERRCSLAKPPSNFTFMMILLTGLVSLLLDLATGCLVHQYVLCLPVYRISCFTCSSADRWFSYAVEKELRASGIVPLLQALDDLSSIKQLTIFILAA